MVPRPKSNLKPTS